MARHRRPNRSTDAEARRRLAATLAVASAVAATLLTVVVRPAAPPAPDRTASGGTTDLAQPGRK
ncbi:hypothetical protein [Streptomyces sp. LN785]|uniref:hypothetical protein n=1 Tax=Streptomyces sp. LN785 TaxID=3112983 RepID=UPI0037122562